MNAEVEVLFFGVLKEVTEVPSLRLWDVSDTNSVKKIIVNRYPLLAEYRYVIALDKQLIGSNRPLHSSHTIAFMPPFSGG